MLIIAIFFTIFYHYRRNPGLFDPFFGELSSTWRSSHWAKLECLGIVLAYVALCYLSRTVPFAPLVKVTPGFLYEVLYGLVTWVWYVLVAVLQELGLPIRAEGVWARAYVRAPPMSESMAHTRGWEMVALPRLPWMENILTIAIGLMF